MIGVRMSWSSVYPTIVYAGDPIAVASPSLFLRTDVFQRGLEERVGLGLLLVALLLGQ